MKIWLAYVLLLICSLAQAETWRFGLIGDVPYSDFERQELPPMIQSINDQNVDLIAHIGDFKNGDTPATADEQRHAKIGDHAMIVWADEN